MTTCSKKTVTYAEKQNFFSSMRTLYTKHSVFKTLFIALILFCSAAFIAAQTNSTQPHTGSVLNLSCKNDRNEVFSAGNDGMVIKWNTNNTGEHFQCSDLPIHMIAVHPSKEEIAVYETDGFSVYRVSVWDWSRKSKKFTKSFNSAITCLNYSAKGTYLLVGTATMQGLNFFSSETGYSKNILSASTGAVTMAQTSNSEASLVVYSPSGLLIYYDLKKGVEKTRFSVEPNLSNPLLYSNNVFLAGIRDDTVYKISATTGKNLSSAKATNPFIVTSPKDSELLFIEKSDNKYNVVKLIDNQKLTLQALKTSEEVTVAAKAYDCFYLGTKGGNIYRLDQTDNYYLSDGGPISVSAFKLIADFCTSPNGSAFALTDEKIIYISPDMETTAFVADNPGITNIAATNTTLYAWSKDSKDGILALDISQLQYANAQGVQQKSFSKIYTPSASIQELKICGNTMIVVEGNSAVTLIDTNTNRQKNRYTGTGYFDAILVNDTDLYIGKTTATNPKYPLIMIDTKTGEIVSLGLKADAIYNLLTDGTTIYGQMYSDSGSSRNSSLFSYQPSAKRYRSLMSGSTGDNTGFAILNNNTIITDFGQQQISAVNLNNTFRSKITETTNVKKASVFNNVLYLLNNNGTFSAWNAVNYSLIGNFTLDSDYGIIAVSQN